MSLRFDGTPDAIWAGLARHGRPIQYAHVPEPLALWDVWTPIAGPPVAFEPPSAGFALDWRALAAMRDRGVAFATLTHAAGISSTGDDELDRRLPFDEPYRIPPATAARDPPGARQGAVVAIGTTVVRALEHAASATAGCGPARGWRRSASAGEPDCASSMRSSPARTSPAPAITSCCARSPTTRRWRRVDEELSASGYRTHEFGDSVLIERWRRAALAVPWFGRGLSCRTGAAATVS